MRRRCSTIRHRSSGNGAGFTLIEILAVILIIGISLMVVTINLEGLTPRYRLRSAAREVGSVIRRARNQAITEGKFYELTYSTEKNQISIVPTYRSEILESKKENYIYVDREESEQRKETSPIYTYDLPERITIKKVVIQTESEQQEEGKILIGPYGYIRPHVVHLSGEGELKKTVIPNPLTGAVRYRNGHVNEEIVIQDDRSSLK